MEGHKRQKTLFTREEITAKVEEMGIEISKDYEGKDLVVLSLLRGSFIFTADLVRELTVPVEVDFMTTSSYGNNEESSGLVEIVHDVRTDIRARMFL